MDMDMCHGLTGCRSDVDADVIAIRIVAVFDRLPYLRKEGEGFGDFHGGKAEQVRFVSPGDDQRVARADGEGVPDGDGAAIGADRSNLANSPAQRASRLHSRDGNTNRRWSSVEGSLHPRVDDRGELGNRPPG